MSAFVKVFDSEARVLEDAEKQTLGQIFPTVDRDNYCFSHWMLQNQMGASLATFGVSVTERKLRSSRALAIIRRLQKQFLCRRCERRESASHPSCIPRCRGEFPRACWI